MRQLRQRRDTQVTKEHMINVLREQNPSLAIKGHGALNPFKGNATRNFTSRWGTFGGGFLSCVVTG
jgi:hypothetical protein